MPDIDNTQLSVSVKVRFTASEVEKLREIADGADMTLSTFIRWCTTSWILFSNTRIIDVLKNVEELSRDNLMHHNGK